MGARVVLGDRPQDVTMKRLTRAAMSPAPPDMDAVEGEGLVTAYDDNVRVSYLVLYYPHAMMIR